MTLNYNTLFGSVDKVQVAINRIQEFEPDDGYHLAFSGGKDSVVLLDLAKMSDVKFDAHYNLTTVDPPELVQFIKTFPEVNIVRPRRTMWQLIAYNKFPPNRHVRYCCTQLKERVGGKGRIVLTGIRSEESSRRAKRQMVEPCNKSTTRGYVHPIIDWTSHEIWQYIKQKGIDYCKLYDEGFDRLGCVLCPYLTPRQKKQQMARWPKLADAWKRAIERTGCDFNHYVYDPKPPPKEQARLFV